MSSVSVIIPAFNRAHLIGETLRSLLMQTRPAEEIIVVDDGSTDGTAGVAESFGQAVRVIRQQNAGPATARNVGFLASSGQFIHFFDSDDIALPNKHEVQLRALQAGEADIAYGPWIKGAISTAEFFPQDHVLQQRGLPAGDLVRALLTHWSVVPHACLFRRALVEKIGGFPENLRVAEDQMMFLKCLLAGARVVHTPGTLELYRTGDEGKITEAASGKERRLFDWARFLLKAREACLQARFQDPAKWFGFRSRIWEVARDLRESRCDASALLVMLDDIWADDTPPWFYKSCRFVNGKKDGLKQRLAGSRSHNCFRSGPLSQSQIAAIRQMGLQCC